MIHLPKDGQAALTTFRICLCMLPGVVLAIGVAVASKLGDRWPLAILPVPFIVILIGYFEGRLGLRQQQVESANQHGRLIRWALFFLLLQTVIAPLFCVVTLFGYSVISNFLRP